MDYNYQENYVEQPQDYKTWSIINLVGSILCCCGGGWCSIIPLVTSIIAMIKSNEVSKSLMMGENGISLAQDASGKAKTLNIVSSVLLGLGLVCAILIWVFYLGAIIADM